MFSALICSVLCFIYNRETEDSTQKKPSAIISVSFFVGSLCWAGAIVYLINANLFVWFNYLFFGVLMYNQVLLYYFVFTLTQVDNRQKFRKIHFIIPSIIVLITGVCSSLIPFEERCELVRSGGFILSGYPVRSFLFSSSTLIFCIYNITYSTLDLLRVRNYRREVINYSADNEKNSASWMYLFVVLTLINIPLPLGATVVNRNMILTVPLTTIGALMALLQHCIILYNLLSKNYVLIDNKEWRYSLASRHAKINHKQFQAYIIEKKPYLNPNLKVTDLCSDLLTNRSYLSAYINKEYGMNFCSYINGLRLRELERLRTTSSAADAPLDLIHRAGFNSYRSYLRAKNDEDEQRVLKIFE
ncbi:hypothetical protein D0T50_06170 [Bacteroides sp. 214]|nr:hypothetical protein [Bacteroides sp. 214]